MISFELKGGLESANQFLKKVTLLIIAPSLGGVESLVTLPATTSHSGMSPEERQRIGISESLVRMSVGIEDRDDLIADLEQALS
jgi:cystathionine beta-lyase/cystathionine gamma-synthase